MQHIGDITKSKRWQEVKERLLKPQPIDEKPEEKLPEGILFPAGHVTIDESFEQHIYECIINRKGFRFFFSGVPGCGKTYHARHIYRTVIDILKPYQYHFYKSSEIWEKYKALVGNKDDKHDLAHFNTIAETDIFFLDDLGGEKNVIGIRDSNYNSVNYISEHLMKLYDYQKRTERPIYSIITSNLTLGKNYEKSEIGMLYGKRVFDRLIELYDEIRFKNESMRTRDNYMIKSIGGSR